MSMWQLTLELNDSGVGRSSLPGERLLGEGSQRAAHVRLCTHAHCTQAPSPGEPLGGGDGLLYTFQLSTLFAA